MDGLLIVDKPEGITSAEVVRRVKRQLLSKTGHLGTLDPFASGVLPLCLGEGTKVAQFLNAADKDYCGTIRLGSATESGDPTGRVTATAIVPTLDQGRLDATAQRFTGEQLQTPPMYSAIKQQGTPLYKLARRGIAVERTPRRVHIDALHLTLADITAVTFTVTCSKGTYVRVLAEDIAAALGTVGHLASLRRTRFGQFTLAQSVALDALTQATVRIIGLREALQVFPEIHLDARAAARARQGYAPVLSGLGAGEPGQVAKLIGPDDLLAAVVVMEVHGWRFARVFREETSAPPLA